MSSHWHPTATIEHLKKRAEILAKIREFFAVRGVLEVETPTLSAATVTDPYLASLSTSLVLPSQSGLKTFYLQTSPEYAMKRLLAAGIGPIYQITKSFRADEAGRLHNPEFTMLEWYRPGFTHRDLMIEMDGLLRRILNCEVAKIESYGDLFLRFCEIDPYNTNVEELKACAKKQGLDMHGDKEPSLTFWLQLLMSEVIEPHLGCDQRPTFVTDFPVEQAALAKINPGPPAVAERFEVYWRGMELANGFHELCDAEEQRRRFEENNRVRREQGLPEMAMDENFLAALVHGLPACAGVALGVDRLVMAALGCDTISDVIAFPADRA